MNWFLLSYSLISICTLVSTRFHYQMKNLMRIRMPEDCVDLTTFLAALPISFSRFFSMTSLVYQQPQHPCLACDESYACSDQIYQHLLNRRLNSYQCSPLGDLLIRKFTLLLKPTSFFEVKF